jgi:hypothetical protein
LVTLFSIGIVLHFGGPQGQVISDKLHDSGGILVLVFFDVFNIGDGVIESLFSEVACFGGVIEDFIVEDGEVEG